LFIRITTQTSPAAFRWMLVALGFGINLCLGSIYSYSVFRNPLEALWCLTSTESGLPFMVFLASFAFTMPFAGGLLDKFGPRTTVLIGSIVVGMGWILAGLSADIYTLTILYGVVGGAGVGVVYGAPTAVTARWFEERAGTAMGLTLLGFGISPLITAPIMSTLIFTVGPLQTFIYFGIASLVILSVFSLPLKFPPDSSSPSTKQVTTTSQEKHLNRA
jgi:OFA family oxalate/formate antiporter-like MFS transporter